MCINPKSLTKPGSTRRFLAILILPTLLLYGCASTGKAYVDAYDTDRFTPEQMAVLHVPESLSVWDLDGEDLNISVRHDGVEIRLGPGQHQATVYYSAPGGGVHMKQNFTLPEADDYFLGHRLFKKKGLQYVQFHVYRCGSEEEKKLKELHNASSYRKYKNACPEVEL